MDDCISVRFEENNNRSAAYDGDQEVGTVLTPLMEMSGSLNTPSSIPPMEEEAWPAVSWTLLSWEPGTAASRSCPCVPTP
mgnify:CR=1 FL=1